MRQKECRSASFLTARLILLFATAPVVIFTANPVLAQATSSFVGTWVWNPNASEITGQTLSIQSAGNNTYIFDNHEGMPFKIVADGTPQKMPEGETMTLKQTDGQTWQSTAKGVTTSTRTYHLAADGRSMKTHQTIVWADGGKDEREIDWQRTDAGTGFAGEWQSRSFQRQSASKPFVMNVVASADHSLRVSLPGEKSEFVFKFDGKEYPDLNPETPKSSTYATSSSGDHNLHLVSKLNGKLAATVDYDLAPDSRSITVHEVVEGQPKPLLFVMEKQ